MDLRMLRIKKIKFIRGLKASKAAIEFAIYHEVAHCADKKLYFWSKYIEPIIYFGTFIIGTITLTVSTNYIINNILSNFIKKNYKMCQNILAISIITSGMLSLQLIPYVVRNYNYQFEHRANIFACKKINTK